MKKLGALIAMVTAFVLLFSFTAFAQEVTDPTKVIKEDTFNADEDLLQREFDNSEIWRAGFYVKYLDGVIYNLNDVARIKKEIVTNYTELAKVNPYFNTLLPNAIKDYEEAVAWVDYYKAYKEAVKLDFSERYK